MAAQVCPVMPHPRVQRFHRVYPTVLDLVEMLLAFRNVAPL